MDEGTDRQIDIVVYLRERGAVACDAPVGFEATICLGALGMQMVTLRPLRDPTAAMAVRPASALWRLAEAFVIVCPAFRHTMTMGA